MQRRITYALCGLLWACGSDEEKACDPVANSGCDTGKVCEVVAGQDPICADPVVLTGNVFALATGAGVAGARVVAIDANGAPASTVATTGVDGSYALTVPAQRNADGTVVAAKVTLRADAATYQAFPGGLRQSLPIGIEAAVAMDGKLVVHSALTDVGLIVLPGAGTGAIAGTVAVAPSRAGILVVAEQASGPGLTAIADSKGDYKIVNVGAGAWTVKAYAKGVSYTPGSATVAAGQTAAANLALSTAASAKVSGMVSLVNAGGATATSVILVVESTFNEALARGESPPGLRAGNVSGSFTIEGVPEGKYVVLAAFENDLLVRDPDTGIGGTTIVHQTVTAGQDVTVAESFKVTGALAVISPGPDAEEAITGTPTFSWVDDSSEEGYKLLVLDALGNTVWTKDVDRSSGTNPSVPYAGPALAKGMVYQFRVTSFRTKGMAGLRPIAATEDLRGVFFVP